MQSTDSDQAQKTLLERWESIYQQRSTEQLGWYEAEPSPSLSLIEETGLPLEAHQLHVGVGSSLLIDRLLEKGYANLTANDLSEASIRILKERLGLAQQKVRWAVDDLTDPAVLETLDPVDLWHDRAVLHFFTEESDRSRYLELLNRLVRPGGHVIIAVFHKNGHKMCNGLPVHGHDSGSLEQLLGDEYSLVRSFEYTYMNPRNEERPYVYTHFKRISS